MYAIVVEKKGYIVNKTLDITTILDKALKIVNSDVANVFLEMARKKYPDEHVKAVDINESAFIVLGNVLKDTYEDSPEAKMFGVQSHNF